jgi:hypothetical protein
LKELQRVLKAVPLPVGVLAYLQDMSIGPGLLKLLQRVYAPSSMVDLRYRGLELKVRTDAHGEPVLLFIGRRQDDGRIKGERYVRTLVHAHDGIRIKDHWELKGTAS